MIVFNMNLFLQQHGEYDFDNVNNFRFPIFSIFYII